MRPLVTALGSVIGSIAVFSALGVAQQSTLPSSSTQQLPGCAASCSLSAILGGLCDTTDRACLCTNELFIQNTTVCTTLSCTIPESLVAKNVSMTLCGAPNRDRSSELFHALVACVTLATVFVALRFFYKIIMEKGKTLGKDDWLTLATLATGAPVALVHMYGTLANGLGRDIWTLEAREITNFGYFFYHSCWAYFIASALLKLSVICFYMRIFPVVGVQRLLWATFAFTALYGAGFALTALFQCTPVRHFWIKWDGLHEGVCADANAIGWSNAVIGIALDLWILGIPLWQIRHLQLRWKRKIAVGLMLCVGALVTVVSILRLQSLVRFAKTHNTSWDYYGISLWSGLEISIGIMCACLPTVRLLLIRLFPILGDQSTSRSKPHVYHRHGSDERVRSGVQAAEEEGTSSSKSKGVGSWGNSVHVVSLPLKQQDAMQTLDGGCRRSIGDAESGEEEEEEGSSAQIHIERRVQIEGDEISLFPMDRDHRNDPWRMDSPDRRG